MNHRLLALSTALALGFAAASASAQVQTGKTDANGPRPSDADARIVEGTEPCVTVALSPNADNTATIQAAVSRAVASRRPVCLNGSGTMAGSVEIAGPVKIRGASQTTTQLVLSGSNLSAFKVTTNKGVEFEALALATPANVTGQTQVEIDPPTGENIKSKFRDVTFFGFNTGIHAIRASLWTVDGCVFSSPYANSVAVVVENRHNADSGDATIVNSLFNADVEKNTTGIVWRSSGGLRVNNNKMANITHPISVAMSDGARTSDLLIEGNSIEGFLTTAISIRRAGPTGKFMNINIVGNQFAVLKAGATIVSIAPDPVGAWLKTVTITGNTFSVGGMGPSTAIAVNATTGFVVTGNVFDFIANAPHTDVFVGPTATAGTVAGNIATGRAQSQIGGTDVAHGVSCPAGKASPSTLTIVRGVVTRC